MRSAAARAELPAICQIHDVEFVQFTNGRQGKGIQKHFGCPVCVEKIRNDVRKLRAGFRRGKAIGV